MTLLRRLRERRWTPWSVAVLAAVTVGLPLLVAAVALHRHHYFPVLDLAMTEFRVRDVGGAHTPLIGLPGRIGKFPAQGSHPGPLSFYLLAPVYRLLGSSGWSLLVAAIVVNVIAFATTVALAFRKGGWRLAAVVAVWLTIVIRGYGTLVLTQPWNPYLPLAAWTVVVLAAWMVADGDHPALVPLVVAGTLCAQTHVPYLVLCVGLFAGALLVCVRRCGWRAIRTSLTWSLAIGVVLWLPPLVDQAIHTPGNISMLKEHFTNTTEQPIGVLAGVRLLLRHLDIVSALSSQRGNGGFVAAASEANRSIVVGLCMVLLWVGCALLSWRMRHRSLATLHAVLGFTVLLEALSMVRIFGKVWYYLTLWAWAVTAAVVMACLATLWCWWVSRRPQRAQRDGRRVAIAAGAVALVCTAVSTTGAVNAQVPEHRLSEALGQLVAPTVDAIRSRTGAASKGADGTYIVSWSDAFFFGSEAYGLVNELERAGIHVGVDHPFAVPVTFHRVIDRPQAQAEIHFASGQYIDQWLAMPGQVEVANIDPRTPAERAEFDRLRSAVIDGLTSLGLADLVKWVDINLFGAAVDGRVPLDLRLKMSRMLDIGEPIAVFIGPVAKV
jgi:hypothetical protein